MGTLTLVVVLIGILVFAGNRGRRDLATLLRRIIEGSGSSGGPGSYGGEA